MEPLKLSFLLMTVALREIKAGIHSLRYFQTSMSQPGLTKPRFISVGYVDDEAFVRFDSYSAGLREEPMVMWLDKSNQNYWERNSRVIRETELTFQVGLQNLQKYYNQSEGVHTYQRLVGCEVTYDGMFKRGFEQFAYNGHDYISLDPTTLSWTAAEPMAVNSKLKWEAERSIAQRQKAYLEDKCVYWLLKYLEYGKEKLLRAAPPSVRITHHTHPDGKVTLQCRAQDFYPAEISLTWLRDGEEQHQDTEFIETRPAGDGTFQKWAAVGVTSGQEGRYTCQVLHKGLPEPLTLKWEPESSSPWIIVGVLAVVVLLISIIAGFIIWRRKKTSSVQDWKGVIRRRHYGDSGNDSAQVSDESDIFFTAKA
ncbi:DLA class I histocompatibility antigen, A9/A9 alpha chain-like isoform X2 [Antechinus flavipes]|uniref:DLA class I histocompatibility antigen, A9/A9 alpha chain-like isoform X2 n=1 Tax=Antechinus flavipes TaxID=38775 RepID=UPI0022364503|nr:DLA class I histocompatibility antigen, A9/A9 alpha chain-like isoform X2 [Antechinus flavipes]